MASVSYSGHLLSALVLEKCSCEIPPLLDVGGGGGGLTRSKAIRLQSLSHSCWLVLTRNPFSADYKCDICLPNSIQ